MCTLQPTLTVIHVAGSGNDQSCVWHRHGDVGKVGAWPVQRNHVDNSTAQHCVLFCQAAHLRRTGCPLPHCEAKGQSVHLPCMRGHSYYQLCGRQVSCAECTCTSFRCSPSRFLVAAMQQCQADHCDMFGLRAARRLWCWCHVRVSDRVQGRARRRRSVRHSSST